MKKKKNNNNKILKYKEMYLYIDLLQFADIDHLQFLVICGYNFVILIFCLMTMMLSFDRLCIFVLFI